MTQSKDPASAARVLIVDDEPFLLHSTSRLLTDAGYQVVEAATGSEGLRLAREVRPDLILLDVILPDMDGMEVCRRIKADPALANTFVAMLSGRRIDSASQAEGLEEGANEYIVRPASERELVARVKAMLRIQHAEEMLRVQMHEVKERVKELDCLYGISRLIEQADLFLPDILAGTADLIPPAWQYPEIACARVVLHGRTYQSRGFVATEWKQSCGIRVYDKLSGSIEVYYKEARPDRDEGPFLREERRLLNAIAERLGRIAERVSAEKALSSSEERYRAVSQLNTDLAYAFRVDCDGSLSPEWMTQSLDRVTGFSAQELETHGGWERIVHPADLPAVQEHMQRLLSGQKDAHELRIITKDGRLRWLHHSGKPVWDDGRDRVVRVYGALRDITERKRVESTLRRYETIVGTVSDPISYVDGDYVYRAVNETYAEFAKKPRAEIVGMHVAELLGTRVFEEQVKPHLDRCLAGDEVHFQAWFPVPDEEAKYMDVGYYPVQDLDGSVAGVVVASRDMTERKQIEEALQWERDLIARVMDTSPVGIAVFDRHGRMTFSNRLLQQLADQARGVTTLLGRSYNDPVWQGTAKDGKPLPDQELPFARVMGCGEPVQNIEHGIKMSDGTQLLLSSNAAPLFDESGEIDSVVVATQDITHRRKAELQLEEAAASAERERIARELHDAVTQTLFSVAAISEALPRVWERNPEEARHGLEELRLLTQGALAEMRTMLLELRPAALLEHELGVLLRQLADAMMGRTRMPVTANVMGDCTLPGDVRVALYRIAQEALNNISKHARASEAELSLHCEPGQARLKVCDNGLGFDGDRVQAHQLGLEIMRERAQAIGAKLNIASRPGHGTRVEVVWPAA